MSLRKESLDCDLCMIGYNEDDHCPRILNCGHTYCTTCLTRICSIDGSIQCPQDRKLTDLKEDVLSLPKNFALLCVLQDDAPKTSGTVDRSCELCEQEDHPASSYCVDCCQAMCQTAAKLHLKTRATKRHDIVAISAVDSEPAAFSVSRFCEDHDQPYRYFDCDCNVLICGDCFVLKHSSHKCLSFQDAVENCKSDLNSKSEEIRSIVEKVVPLQECALASLRTLEQLHKEAHDKLEGDFVQFFQTLTARRDALHKELEDAFTVKTTALQKQFEFLQAVHIKSSSALDQASNALKQAKDFPILLAYSDAHKILQSKQCKAIVDLPSALTILKPTADALKISYSISQQECEQSPGDFLDWIALGYGLEFMVPGYENSFILQPKNTRNAVLAGIHPHVEVLPVKKQPSAQAPYKIGDLSICLFDDVVPGETDLTITALDNGTYRVVYSCTLDVSILQISVMMGSFHIKGSPFTTPGFLKLMQGFLISEQPGKYVTDFHGADVKQAYARSVPLPSKGKWKFRVRIQTYERGERSSITLFNERYNARGSYGPKDYRIEAASWYDVPVGISNGSCFLGYSSVPCQEDECFTLGVYLTANGEFSIDEFSISPSN